MPVAAFCEVNHDEIFMKAFEEGVNYIRDSNGGFVLLNKDGKEVLRAHNKNPPVHIPTPPSRPSSPKPPRPSPVSPKPTVIPKDLSGQYGIDVPGQVLTDIVLLDVDSKHFIFSGGCNVHSFEYKANEANGRIKFGNRTSTEKACERDEDHLFLDAFEKVE